MAADSPKFQQIFWIMVVGVLVVWNCFGDAQSSRNRSGRRRQGGRGSGPRRGGLDPELHRAYLEAIGGGVGSSGNSEGAGGPTQMQSQWPLYTPQLPGPDEVECFVNVYTTVRHNGRCLRLGGENDTFACVSGPHMRINRLCQGIVEAREPGNDRK